MATNKILYVCQEISPYLPENDFSKLSLEMARQMQERGAEVRTFMPRYGCINERRNQLHEVIRLSREKERSAADPRARSRLPRSPCVNS